MDENIINYQILTDDSVMVVGIQLNNKNEYHLNIPPYTEINGNKYKVTGICPEAFWGDNHLKSVTIPNTVTFIGNGAFNQCERLECATIPDSVIEIGEYAFSYCPSLTTINIPNSLKEIGCQIFECSNKVKLDLGLFLYDNGTKCYGYLGDTKKVKEITIPEGVTYIQDYAFDGCTKLEKINFPNSLKTIGMRAFKSCRSLKNIILPDGVELIGREIFKTCIKLETAYIPDSVKQMAIDVFTNCPNLNEVRLPDGYISYLKISKCPYEEKYKRLKELNKFAVKALLDSLKKAPGCKYLKATGIDATACEISLIYEKITLWKSVIKTTDLATKAEELKNIAANYEQLYAEARK